MEERGRVGAHRAGRPLVTEERSLSYEFRGGCRAGRTNRGFGFGSVGFSSVLLGVGRVLRSLSGTVKQPEDGGTDVQGLPVQSTEAMGVRNVF